MFNEFLETNPAIPLPIKTSRSTRGYLLQQLHYFQTLPIFKQSNDLTTFQAEDAYLFANHSLNSQNLIQLVNSTREEQKTLLFQSLVWPSGSILQSLLENESSTKHINYGLAVLLFGMSSNFTPELINYVDMYAVSHQLGSIFSGVAPNLWHYTSLFSNSAEEMPILLGQTFYLYRQTKLAYNYIKSDVQLISDPEKVLCDAIIWSSKFRKEEFHEHVMNPEKQTTTLLKQALIMFQ